MGYHELQKDLICYLRSKPNIWVIAQFSQIMILIYPIYLLLGNFSVLNFVMGAVGTISAVLYVTYIMGLIFSFAKNDMKIIGIAFAIKALDCLIRIIMYSFRISTILYLILYVALAIAVFYGTTFSNNN